MTGSDWQGLIWRQHPDRNWSSDARLCGSYLLSGPASNRIGCFIVALEDATRETGLSAESVTSAFAELEQGGFIRVDSQCGWMWIPEMLQKHPFADSEEVRRALPELAAVPRNATFHGDLIRAFRISADRPGTAGASAPEYAWLARLLGEARISDLANRLSSASAVVKTRLPGLPSLSAERLHPTALLLIQIVDYTRRCKRFLFDLVNTRLLRFLSLFAVFAAILFVVFPSIDLGVARWFFQPPHSFQLGETWIGRFFDGDVHFGMEWFLALLVGTFLYGQIKRRNYFGLTRKRFLFIALSIGLGAGLLTNVVLKDTWGRARPSQVTEFGGTKQFTPPFVRSTQCDRNCSFVSGDASLAAGFLTFAMIADRHRRRWWIGLGGFAALVGVMRMARGSHFLSDVVFGVLFTLMISLILKRLIIEDRWRAWPRLRRDSRLDDSERSKPA